MSAEGQGGSQAGKRQYRPRSHGSPLRIDVTAEVLARSCQKDSSHCMIADAIKRALPQMHDISVDLQTIRFSDREKGERYIFLTPEGAQQQLLRFDWGEKIDPWHFHLPRPAQIVKIVSREDRPNHAGRPLRREPKRLRDQQQEVQRDLCLEGGEPPSLGVLAHSSRPPRSEAAAPPLPGAVPGSELSPSPTGPGAARGARLNYRGRRRQFGMRLTVDIPERIQGDPLLPGKAEE